MHKSKNNEGAMNCIYPWFLSVNYEHFANLCFIYYHLQLFWSILEPISGYMLVHS